MTDCNECGAYRHQINNMIIDLRNIINAVGATPSIQSRAAAYIEAAEKALVQIQKRAEARQ